MSRPDAGEGEVSKPTVPSEGTAAATSGRTRLTIRWVFPLRLAGLTPLGGELIVIGREEPSTVLLPSDQVSRVHAEITREGQGYLLRDRKSMNGVFVHGARVGAAPLVEGTVFRIGDVLGVVVALPDGQGDSDGDADADAFDTVIPGYFAGPVLARRLRPLRKVARTDLPVVLQGQTGTGKEGLASAVHTWSGRTGQFVAVNCAALPESLAEGELFGYRRGAFTGADQASRGHFRASHGGTLFLDEVLELPLALQAKLLRVLEQREVVPLGQSVAEPVDLRIVVAAQVPLRAAVADGKLRGDLYARLEGLTVELPPLRERVEEIPFLFSRILEKRAGKAAPPAIDVGLAERLCLYDWPFNVRELDLVARQLLALHGDEPLLRRSHLPERLLANLTPPERPAAPRQARQPGDTPDIDQVVMLLRANQGNVKQTAAALGISRPKLYRLMEGAKDVDWDQLRKDGDDGV
jgi:transcriptional regulator with PAS, ATPase and Fis domain